MKPPSVAGCYCLCKDTNSQASHNVIAGRPFRVLVVIAYAKILILKQVTTRRQDLLAPNGCYCLCKDTNSQASHNVVPCLDHLGVVVIAYAKILILKQVTTCALSTYFFRSCYCLCKDTNSQASHNP